jgi:Rod binding domain-containing protein
MDIAQIGALPAMSANVANAVNGIRVNDAAGQFDALLYRLLLQSSRWTSGIAAGRHADGAVFAGMINDFLAQEIARHQSGFGAMLLKTIEGQQGSKA